jgi:hypothetical protein
MALTTSAQLKRGTCTAHIGLQGAIYRAFDVTLTLMFLVTWRFRPPVALYELRPNIFLTYLYPYCTSKP